MSIELLDMIQLAQELAELRDNQETCACCFGPIYKRQSGEYHHGLSLELAKTKHHDADEDHAASPNLEEGDKERLAKLEALEAQLAKLEGWEPDKKKWSIDRIDGPVIALSTFQEYVQEQAEEHAANVFRIDVSKLDAWKYIDWAKKAQDDRSDYVEFEFEDDTWLYLNG